MNKNHEGQSNEREIQDSENDIERLFQLVPTMVCIASQNGYLKKINSAWTKILGHSQEELLSKPFFDFIHPEDIDSTSHEIKKQVNGNNTIDFINRYRCKDGSYRLLEWKATPGSDGFLYATARDITEHKRLEEEREFNNNDLLFLNSIANKLVQLTYSEKIEEFLPKQIMVYSSAEVAVFSLYDPDKHALITKHIEADQYILKKVVELGGHRILETESPVSTRIHAMILDKGISVSHSLSEVTFDAIPVSISKAIQFITGIDRFYAIAHVVDGDLFGTTVLGYKKGKSAPREELLKSYTYLCAVSLKRMSAEKKLKESEDRFRRLAENARDMIYRMSLPDGVYEYVSPASTEIFGYAPEEFLNTPLLIRKAIHPEWDDYFIEQWDLILKGVVSPTYEYQIVHGNSGEIKWLNQRNILIKNDEGQPIAIEAIVTDITEQKHTEEVLQNSQKLESLGVLAGGIAHDFNNLLGGILGNIQMAMLKSKEENVSTYLSRSLSSIDRTRALTQQLLTFAKGGTPIKKVENFSPFIQDTTQFALSGSSTFSRFQIEKDLWLCECDKNQIGQVIDNLIQNAQQAMANGGTIDISACNISFSVKEHHSLVAGNYVKLSIRDYGIGISKEYLPSIFDPYYTTKSNGHGLGLSTCYSIVNRHGGCIDVESEFGKGSTFHVFLPAYTESPLIKVEGYTKRDSCEHTGNGTFLVMDDEKIIRESMKDILEDFGYTVVLKENGKDAIDFFINEINENRNLAGMIFDLTIPGGMGGEEAIREIRKICSSTPAFVVSGYSSNPVIANPEKYGFNASICKPFMMDELSVMLEKHMKKF